MREKIIKILEAASGRKDIELSVPKDTAHGDYATNIAMLLAKEAGKNPREIALELKEKIEKHDKGSLLSGVEIAGPGFINLKVNDSLLRESITDIISHGEMFGCSTLGKGKKVLIEFVSANPTGPLHIGHGRWAAIGDSIANILSAAGYEVTKEFYINNVGRQVDRLFESVMAASKGLPTPEEGYGGAYVKDIAESIKGVDGQDIKSFILNSILNDQKDTLKLLNVNFDNWFAENTLHEAGEITKTVESLKKKNVTYEKDGALWFKSTEFGDDKDRVLVRENGEPTYFAADITYHADKFKRGYDLLINVWGTDHHGYVKRLQSALEALHLPSQKLDIIIGQLVALFRGDEQVRMSKRTGDMITLREVIEETGPDATRFFLLMMSADTHLNFDLELAKKKTLENPVYYVQYAHARISSVFKEAGKLPDKADLSLLIDPSERELIKKLADYPDFLKASAMSMEPHNIVRYSRELAALLHSYYHKCRVITEDKALTSARLVLLNATRIVLSNMLKLLGVTAPERM